MKKFYLFLVALVVSVFAANAAEDNLYIFGEDFGGWNAFPGQEMTAKGNGVFTKDVHFSGAGKMFRFNANPNASDSNSWSDVWDWGAGKKDQHKDIAVNVTMDIKGEHSHTYEGNFKSPGEGDYTITVDTATGKITLSERATTPTISKLYFYSEKMSGGWNTSGTEMNYVDGVYTLDVNFDDVKYFAFRTYANDLQWGKNDNTQWGPTGNVTIQLNKDANISKNGNAACYTESLSGTHKIQVVLGESTGTVKVIGEEEPEKPCTIYFINKSAEGWENGEAHAWGNGIDTKVKLAGTSYRYKDADGKIFDIYSATFDKAAKNIQFTYNGNWAPENSGYDFKDEAIYCTGGIVAEKGNYSWYEELPIDLQTLYFRANADWVMDTNHKTPVAVFNGTDVAENRVEMTPIAGEACLFSVEFDKNKYSSVSFVIGGIAYPINEAFWPNRNDEDWYTYIYCADGDTNGNKFAAQSYLRFNEYVELRDGKRVDYCVIGSTTDNWSSTKNPVVEDGLCIFETGLLGAGAKFKMSYITPSKVRPNTTPKINNNQDDNKCWWATFNLGVVGPNPADAGDGGTNQYINYTPRVPMEYNHYCEYDWQVNNVGEGDSKYYVVIDPSTKVTVLITFNPNPKITKFSTELDGYTKPGDLDQYEIENLGKYLRGAAQSGDARIRRVNQSNGKLTIRPAQRPEDFDALYTLDYQLYFNNVLVGEFAFDDIQGYATVVDGVKYYEIPFVGLTPGSSDIVSFNAEYTHKDSGLKFHSYTTEVKYTNQIDFDDLGNVAFGKVMPFLSHKNDDGKYTWDAIAEVKFTAAFDTNVAGSKVFYPTCEVLKDGGCIVDATNRFYASEYFRNAYGWGEDFVPYTKYNDGNYDHDVHNWSIKARDAQTFYVYVPDVATTDTGYSQDIDMQFSVELYAQYPFLIQKVDDAYGIRRGAPAMKAESENAVKVPMTFNLVEKGDTYTYTGTVSGTSGVNDIELGEEEGEVELYNLQGIRVEGQPAAGVYLRRVGNTVEKVYIR